ncbi:D,D-heptose 1,7-bisphosphate phosphatase [Sporosarcina sp. NCCP-2222]|uniref:D-glycero-alpha-D-manno-heptose-1,7-bisphosphate 7-phosphatase n=1 Tax=Sporosarcina sp. NCCP-2222 TaxID=2935073 RepID=UPI00208489CF|nr:HAD-IIIA family hydrolase [Sporosarcina sp. NCCP-2222]GKV56129.1 D,D-heptose 1,7-bisphosphate phosphatase [Sporosarcina sp. NCCP-2222]
MKVAFFDRDGTIIKDYLDEEWTGVSEPVFLPDAIDTLRQVRQKGYDIIIITNQYLINEGFITVKQYETVQAMLLLELEKQGVDILAVFYCPHRRNEGCNCCKPETGMILQALDDYPSIDLKSSFVIGDSGVDMELARRMNMRGFGIKVSIPEDVTDIKQVNEVADVLGYI